jgi:hypothetical protein
MHELPGARARARARHPLASIYDRPRESNFTAREPARLPLLPSFPPPPEGGPSTDVSPTCGGAGGGGGRRTRTRGNLDHPSFGLIITVFRFGAFCPRREDPPAHDLRYRGVAHPARSYTHEYAYIRHRRKYEGKKRVSFTRERRPAARGRGEGAAEGTRGREAGQSVGL